MATVICPNCGARDQVREEPGTGAVHCEQCQHRFFVPEVVPKRESVVVQVVPTLPPRSSGATKEDDEFPAYSPTRRRRAWVKTGLIIGGVVLAVGGLAAMGYFWFMHEIEEPVTAVDRETVITAERFARLNPDVRPNPNWGKFRKVRHFDGSRELTYEYETPEDADDYLYIECTVYVEPTAKDAQLAFTGLRLGTNVGFHLAATGENKVEQVERNELWRWGDESKCVLLRTEGQSFGNLFMARKGRRYFTLIVSGVYYDDAEDIRELLAPMLGRLESYNG